MTEQKSSNVDAANEVRVAKKKWKVAKQLYITCPVCEGLNIFDVTGVPTSAITSSTSEFNCKCCGRRMRLND